jgi:membrane-associated phospholipid phosphatase
MTRTLKIWLASLALTVAAESVSFTWLDRPMALWIHGILGQRYFSDQIVRSPLVSIPLLAALAFVVVGLVAIDGRHFSKIEKVMAVAIINVLITIVIKDQLKFMFGRTWPDTWTPGIVSFLQDGVYGFHFFQPGKSFESFPSGHAAVAAAVLSVGWILSPKLRALFAAGIVAVDVALVALNLHFLSDVIAGSFLGCSTGLFTVTLWRASAFGEGSKRCQDASKAMFRV